MGTALVVAGSRQLAYQTYDDPPLKSDEVRIQTLYSGISAGTEMTQYRGTNPYMNNRWDENVRLFTPGGASSWTYPIFNLGYEEVGKTNPIRLGRHVCAC